MVPSHTGSVLYFTLWALLSSNYCSLPLKFAWRWRPAASTTHTHAGQPSLWGFLWLVRLPSNSVSVTRPPAHLAKCWGVVAMTLKVQSSCCWLGRFCQSAVPNGPFLPLVSWSPSSYFRRLDGRRRGSRCAVTRGMLGYFNSFLAGSGSKQPRWALLASPLLFYNRWWAVPRESCRGLGLCQFTSHIVKNKLLSYST